MNVSTVCTTVALFFMLLAAIFVAPHLDWPTARITCLVCIAIGFSFFVLSWWL